MRPPINGEGSLLLAESRFFFAWVFLSISCPALAQHGEQRPFTSRDAVEVAYFGNLLRSKLYQTHDDGSVSPGGQSAIQITHRGVLQDGSTEGTLWLFDVDDLLQSIEKPESNPPEPLALARMSAAINGYSTDFANLGNTLLHPKWSNDGQSVFFLGRDGRENRQLFRVDLNDRRVTVLSPPDRDVFAYSVSGPRIVLLVDRGIQSDDVWRVEGAGIDDIVIGTGQALNPLLFPNFREYANATPLELEVWQVEEHTAVPVLAVDSDDPLRVSARFGDEDIVVAPNGNEAVAVLEGPTGPASDRDMTRYLVIDLDSGSYRETTLLAAAELSWTPFPTSKGGVKPPIRLSVSEGLNKPPVLVATDPATGESREIFDPNPQLRDIELLPVEVLEWKDKHDRTVIGGLIKPAGYDAGRRYALVIQTHGFEQNRFFRVGNSETANAGRALASRDIVVLQVSEPDPFTELPLDLEKAGLDIYIAAIDDLALKGIVDPEKVGISGYSLTGLTVAASITRAPDRFAAAVIANADPLTLTGYYSYVDSPLDGATEDLFTGAAPIGDGLQAWLEKSPSLSTDSIKAAVLVSATDPFHLLSLWDFYAALRYQRKPVELQFIRSGKHNLMKPLHRVSHQELIVDWFDFWLNAHEHEDPGKTDQYERWRQMR